MSTLFVKNMVCNRCILIVRNELYRLGMDVKDIKLGEFTLARNLTVKEKDRLEEAVVSFGFEIIDDKKSRLIERIKNIIIDLVHYRDNEAKTNLSDILREKLNHDYN